MFHAIEALWAEYAAIGKNSEGKLALETGDEKIEAYFEPDQPGGEFVEENDLDLDECKAIVHAYIDTLGRSRVPSLAKMKARAEESAASAEFAAQHYTQGGTEQGHMGAGVITYELRDSYEAEHDAGPEVAVISDVPYVGTDQYGKDRGKLGGAELYNKTAVDTAMAARRPR